MSERVHPSTYDRNYFENGTVLGISGYFNYTWLPELTLRMVFYLIRELGIGPKDVILDFGCAKGYVVKAFRIFDFEAYGVDISEYAIRLADSEVRDHCALVTGVDDPSLFARRYDWLIAKDTFEHMSPAELERLLPRALEHVRQMFVVVPVAGDDETGKYVVPDYDKDITHVTAKTTAWWQVLFTRHGWRVKDLRYAFPGCKENWTAKWPEGNAFFVLSST